MKALGGWKVQGWTKKEKDSWTWTTVHGLWKGGRWVEVEEGIKGINGKRKNRMKNKIKYPCER